MVHGLYVEVETVVEKYLPRGIHSFLFIGGRGIGKTYGALDYLYKIGTGKVKVGNCEPGGKFLYMRRTAVEAESAASGTACCFKAYNMQEKKRIEGDFVSKLGFGTFKNFTEGDEEDQIIGYSAALSTFSNLRGVDFSDVVIIMYDECIPENKNKRPLRDEGELLLNTLETINRNRKIQGKEEVILMLLCNPIDLGNPLMAQLGITGILSKMIFKEEQNRTVPEMGLHIEKYKDHPVSKLKKDGMVYKLGSKTKFADKALSGDFVDNDMSVILRNADLREYMPYLTLETVTVYFHKSLPKVHVSQVCVKAQYNYTILEREYVKTAFLFRYKTLVATHSVTYDDFQTKMAFEQMIGYKPPVF